MSTVTLLFGFGNLGPLDPYIPNTKLVHKKQYRPVKLAVIKQSGEACLEKQTKQTYTLEKTKNMYLPGFRTTVGARQLAVTNYLFSFASDSLGLRPARISSASILNPIPQDRGHVVSVEEVYGDLCCKLSIIIKLKRCRP